MPDDLDKQRIRQRFARSLDTYADAATVQRTMAHDLLRDLLHVADGQRTFPRIAEAGCGTPGEGRRRARRPRLKKNRPVRGDLCYTYGTDEKD